MKAVSTIPSPVGFLNLIGHALRWQLLAALARSDYRVQDLARMAGQPVNLVSYHLGRLRRIRLVRERRSDADSRDVYYHLDLDRLRNLYLASGEALHPILGGAVSRSEEATAVTPEPLRILFLCAENSARSQMAEGILRHHCRGPVEVFSAGTYPTSVHPFAVRVLAEMKIDISGQRAKALDEFLGQSFDYIVTVCDRAKEVCPTFPGDPVRIHWSIPNPTAVDGEEACYKAFKDTAAQLLTMIRYLVIIADRQRGRSVRPHSEK